MISDKNQIKLCWNDDIDGVDGVWNGKLMILMVSGMGNWCLEMDVVNIGHMSRMGHFWQFIKSFLRAFFAEECKYICGSVRF